MHARRARACVSLWVPPGGGESLRVMRVVFMLRGLEGELEALRTRKKSAMPGFETEPTEARTQSIEREYEDAARASVPAPGDGGAAMDVEPSASSAAKDADTGDVEMGADGGREQPEPPLRSYANSDSTHKDVQKNHASKRTSPNKAGHT